MDSFSALLASGLQPRASNCAHNMLNDPFLCMSCTGCLRPPFSTCLYDMTIRPIQRDVRNALAKLEQDILVVPVLRPGSPLM